MFHLWFNTFFIKNEELILRKEEIDKANKDKKCKIYDKNFTVEVQFARLDENGVEIAGRQRSSLFVSPGEVPAAKYQPPSAMSLLQEQMYVRAHGRNRRTHRAHSSSALFIQWSFRVRQAPGGPDGRERADRPPAVRERHSGRGRREPV